MATKKTTTVTATTETKQSLSKLDKVFAEMDKRQEAIESTLKCKVFPIVLLSHEKEDDFVLGFAKCPDLITQLRIEDESQARGVDVSVESCNKALAQLIIKSETDPRIDADVDVKYWKGACKLLVQFLTYAIPLIKKK